MTQFRKGDTVKLIPSLAVKFNRSARGGNKPDWLKRRGIIKSIGTTNHMITIQWEDRRTLDHWSPKALELAPPL